THTGERLVRKSRTQRTTYRASLSCLCDSEPPQLREISPLPDLAGRYQLQRGQHGGGGQRRTEQKRDHVLALLHRVLIAERDQLAREARFEHQVTCELRTGRA